MQKIEIEKKQEISKPVELWPKQRHIVDWIKRKVINHQPAIFFAGQRSGKNVMVSEAVAETVTCFSRIIAVAVTLEQARLNVIHPLVDAILHRYVNEEIQVLPEIYICTASELKKELEKAESFSTVEHSDRFFLESLVVVDEAPWIEGIEPLLVRTSWMAAGLIAFGSPSDYDDWQFKDYCPRWATWEVNPNLPMHNPYIKQKFARDKRVAMRDFGCNIPHPAVIA